MLAGPPKPITTVHQEVELPTWHLQARGEPGCQEAEMTKMKGLDGRILLALLAITLFAGCTGGNEDSVTVEGDIALAYTKRPNNIVMNPTSGARAIGEGGDLMIREKSSPSSPEYNVTAQFTQGRGDVSDPEASYDGKKVVFAMLCPRSNTATINGQPACTGRWNIWEYDMSHTTRLDQGTFRRITSSTEFHDVDPAYLPAGRGFVFSSNRQAMSYTIPVLGRNYYALDEYEREQVLNLHTMDNDGNHIEQISFNMSHDRNPVVRMDGDIMFSRWDHIGDRNHFVIFRVKPDGADMFVLYGAHSDGNSFLHPRDMDPNGPYRGFVTSSLMPLQRTQEGGGIMIIDAANYSEQNTPASTSVPSQGGQRQATQAALNIERGLSRFGRVTTPFPLWDGTNRILASFTPCQVRRRGVIVSCATLSDADLDRLSDQSRLIADIVADEVQADAPTSYGIYMFNPANQTWRVVATPPPGFNYLDPIPLQARAEPNAPSPTNMDEGLKNAGLALIEIRSVYDTDDLGRMGDPVLADADRAPGCPPVRDPGGNRANDLIPKKRPDDPLDTRAWVADLARMKDPTSRYTSAGYTSASPYNCQPAHFIRATRAVPPPTGTLGLRRAIGATNFEPQQIVGYAAIEPDGSFKLQIPADVPVTLTVIDAKGRGFQVHTNWIQARPGERRTCDGCHGLRRGGALNSGAIVGNHPNTLMAAQPGETMASTRTRLNASALNVFADMTFTDVWANTAISGVAPRSPIDIRYSGLATAAPVNGIINYPDHIQPLWERNRGNNTCTNCHTDPVKLDLRGGNAGTGRLTSYEELMVGDPVIGANGLPQMIVQNGVQVIERGPALVDIRASEANATGMARRSRLIEILFGESLLSSDEARATHPNPPASAPDHSVMLSAAEKRLVSEWIDVGGEYYNNPFDAFGGARNISTLDETVFEQQVFPILRSACAANCHQGVGSDSNVPPGTSFTDNRYVLTGDVDGDLNSTLTMIDNTCTPDSALLLSRPTSLPTAAIHPANPLVPTEAVLPSGSTNWGIIRAWIASGCPTP
jgi:hypothetical protein